MITTPDSVTLKNYCSMFGITTLDQLVEMNSDWIWESAVSSAEGVEPHTKEWEERVDSLSEELWSKVNKAYNTSLEATFKYLSMLGVDPSLGEDDAVHFSSSNWEEAGQAILESINGYGLFHYDDLEDLISCGPYDGAKGAVISHLHWHKIRGEVYGDRGIQEVFDQCLENRFRYL